MLVEDCCRKEEMERRGETSEETLVGELKSECSEGSAFETQGLHLEIFIFSFWIAPS